MKKSRLASFVLMMFILVGCSNNEIVDDTAPTEPEDTSEARLPPPPQFGLETSNQFAEITSDNYCWEEEESPCSLNPKDPEALLEGTNDFIASTDELLTILISTSGTYNHLLNDDEFTEYLNPDSMSIVQTSYSGEQTNIELEGNSFRAPSNSGIYYFTVNSKWEGETFKGEAIHGFILSVSN